MGELPEGAVPSRRELSVIEIQHMAADAVRESGVLRRELSVRPEHRRFGGAGKFGQVPVDPAACLFRGARDHCREPIEQVLFRQLLDGARNVVRLKAGYPGGESFGDIGLPLSHVNRYVTTKRTKDTKEKFEIRISEFEMATLVLCANFVV
jgi:hypothetical protein